MTAMCMLLSLAILITGYLQYKGIEDNQKIMELITLTNKRIDLLEAKGEITEKVGENEENN